MIPKHIFCLFFFKAIPSISSKLKTQKDVGLGYIQIGQSATTLSGGEAQRIKLAKELSKRSTGKTIYILDEPTTALHTHDVSKLDLGPEGGDKGGFVLYEGTVENLLKEEKNDTAVCLKTFLKQ